MVSFEAYKDIFNFCKELNIDFILSVYDEEGAEFSKNMGAVALKIPSSNIVHKTLIQYTASLKLPLILDTGKSSLEEIARAVDWIYESECTSLIIEHSPDAPPASLNNHNLKILKTLKKIYSIPVGLSDHHSSEEMLYAAVALGANVIEKGIIPENMSNDLDVYHALPVQKFRDTYNKCLNIYHALGNNIRRRNIDIKKQYQWRMSIVANKSLQPGDRLSKSNISYAFPPKGIPIENLEIVENWTIRNNLEIGQVIKWTDIEPLLPRTPAYLDLVPKKFKFFPLDNKSILGKLCNCLGAGKYYTTQPNSTKLLAFYFLKKGKNKYFLKVIPHEQKEKFFLADEISHFLNKKIK